MNNLQALFNGLSAEWQKERAATQMTLGQLIKELEQLPQDKIVENFGSLDSYRGYYSDLAFEPTVGTQTVESLLATCRAAMGEIFQGYKGGDYMMGANTPIHMAFYGSCGDRWVGLSVKDTVTAITAPGDLK